MYAIYETEDEFIMGLVSDCFVIQFCLYAVKNQNITIHQGENFPCYRLFF